MNCRLILLGLFVVVLCSFATAIDPTTAKVYYGFGNCTDLSGNGGDCTNQGADLNGLGVFGDGLTCDGTNYVQAVDMNTIGIADSASFSIMGLYYSNSFTDNDNFFGNEITNDGIQLRQHTVANGYDFDGGDGAFTQGTVHAMNTQVWYHIAFLFNATDDTWYIYENNTLIDSGTTQDLTHNGIQILCADNPNSRLGDVSIDEWGIWDYLVNESERESHMLYGHSLATPLATFSTTLLYPTNATTYYGTYNGTIAVSLSNVNGTATCTLSDSNWLENTTEPYGNETVAFYRTGDIPEYNISLSYECSDASHTVNSTFWFINDQVDLVDFDYSNYITYLGNNYTRNLTYTANYTCPAYSNTSLILYRNLSKVSTIPLTCDGTYNTYSGNTIVPTEGTYGLYFLFNTTFEPALNNEIAGNLSFIYDLQKPTALVNFTAATGFNLSHATNVTLKCTDNISPILTYSLSFNGNSLFYGNKTAGLTQWNSSTLNDGNNTALGVCSDFFSSDTNTYIASVYAKTLFLIDEKENTAFNVTNISGARVYFDDNSSFYDFKVSNTNQINFTSIDIQKLRFELVYSNGLIITRYIDNTLIDDDELRVCANKEGITHYEQLILSATQKKALLKNVFSNCYVSADYTRFAYQDAYILKAFTISSLYYLSASVNGVVTYLASVDGSIPTYINLDTLEFQQTAYNLNILRDALTFTETSDPDIIEIYYKNLAEDNTEVDITITRMDTSVTVFTLTETTNPNEWRILFDKSTLLNVTNSTLFKIQLDKTTASGTAIIKRYFNFGGGSGVLTSGFAFVISILLTVFGLTFTVARLTFSYFGVIIQIIAIAFISFATMTWYLLFLLGMDVIILVFIIMLMFKQNYPTVS